MFYNIILKSRASFLDTMFTYKSNKEILPGTRVIVPFGNGNKKTIGIVINKSNEEFDYDIKEISEIIDSKPIINEELINLAFYMIKNNLSDYSSAINTILPPGSIDKVKEYYQINDKSIESDKIDEDLYIFLEEARLYEEIDKKFSNKYKVSFINELVELGLLDSFFNLNRPSSNKYLETVYLIDDEFSEKIRKNAFKQLEVLNYLSKNNEIEKKELLEKTLSTTQVLNTLIDKNLIKIKKELVYRDVLDDVKKYDAHILNEEQQLAYDQVVNSSNEVFLLHGVTGSGKTEVYLQIVENVLESGKEAIILVPEISLTPQTIDRFQGRFGRNIAVLHSKLSISERADQWRLIKNKKVKIVVGARSAIFAPFENLGVIVIDEEHETSYRSDKNPKYSAIDIAQERIKYHNANLILGTATPSMKTMYEVYKGEINLLKLNQRVNTSKLPDISVVDMREELKLSNLSMFSNLLKENIDKALSNDEQIILFLNKRGHTSFVFCRICGYVYKCEACDVAMTYHKSKGRLICHYCGRTGAKTKTCINCGSKWIKEYGAGTEMLEEAAKYEFPNAKIYRMDADTIKSKYDYEKIYRMMQNKEIDILIGTQMLAKGLDFPNVSVVGIVSADISLNIPDFRSSEKTYGLITQVSGRAGRGNTDGNVIIQTYNPDHYAIKTAAENNYLEFFNKEMDERNKFNYPPFVVILKINIASKDRRYGISKGQEIMIKINSILREYKYELIEMTGPTPSIIERINNWYRFDIILKHKDKNVLINIANKLRELKKDNNIHINYKLEEE